MSFKTFSTQGTTVVTNQNVLTAVTTNTLACQGTKQEVLVKLLI